MKKSELFKFIFSGVIFIVSIIFAITMSTTNASGKSEQCPDGIIKYDSGEYFKSVVSGDTITFPYTTTFCVKAGQFISGIVIGTTYTVPSGQDISNFVLYEPTAVELLSFTSQVKKNNTVIKWETANETNVCGFNLYRSKTKDSEIKYLSFFNTESVGTVSGSNYKYIDKKRNKHNTYWLEILDCSGNSELFKADKIKD